MAIKPIQTIEGGPEYDPWATAEQMERLIKSLLTSGISQRDAQQLVDLLGDIKKGDKVDQQTLRQVLGNLKTGVAQDKQGAKAQEQQDKAERGFWQASTRNAQNAARAFKNANIADALRETRDLGMVPIQSLSDAFVKVTNIVGAFGRGIFSAANSIISSLGKIGAGVGKVLGVFGGIIAGIGGLITTGVATLLGAIDGMADVFSALYNSGINMAVQQGKLGHGFENLLVAASNARMTIGEFGEFIAENSRLAVAIGAGAMGELSNTVRKALLPMGMYGLSMSELNEYMSDYLEMTRITGTLDAMDRAEQAKGAQDYLEMITSLTAITGKRREQISAELKTQSQSEDWIAFMGTVPDEMKQQVGETAMAMRTWFNQFGTEFGDAITDSFVNPSKFAASEFGQSLAIASLDVEAAAITDLLWSAKNGEITKAEMLVRLNNLKDSIIGNNRSKIIRAEARAANVDQVNQAIRFTGQLEKAGKAATAEQLKLDALTAAALSADELFTSLRTTWTNFLKGIFTDPLFKDAMTDLSNEFKAIMDPEKPLAQALKALAEAAGGSLIKGLTAISDHVGTTEFATVMASLPGLFDSLGTALKGAVTYLRDFFFTKKITASDINDPIDFYTETWEFKSGDEIMDRMKQAFASMWATITDKEGVIVTSLVKGFETLGEMLVEPITNVMVAAFKNIGQMLKDAIRDTLAEFVPGMDTSAEVRQKEEAKKLENQAATLKQQLDANSGPGGDVEKQQELLDKLQENADAYRANQSEHIGPDRASGAQILTTTAVGAATYGVAKKVYKTGRDLYTGGKGLYTGLSGGKVVVDAAKVGAGSADEIADAALKDGGKKKLGKAIGGSIAKKIPGASIIAGVAFGIDRMMEGDYAGAGIEIASGATGTIPIVGTAISTALDVYQYNRLANGEPGLREDPLNMFKPPQEQDHGHQTDELNRLNGEILELSEQARTGDPSKQRERMERVRVLKRELRKLNSIQKEKEAEALAKIAEKKAAELARVSYTDLYTKDDTLGESDQGRASSEFVLSGQIAEQRRIIDAIERMRSEVVDVIKEQTGKNEAIGTATIKATRDNSIYVD